MENKYKYYVSYDAADKTLARSFIKIEDLLTCATRAHNRLLNFISAAGTVEQLKDCLMKVKCDLQFINFYDYGVSDILHGKKVRDCTDLQRSKLLMSHLNDSSLSNDKLTHYAGKSNVHVIIEHQPAKINSKSPQIEHQLTMYYLCGGHDVIHVCGAIKNKITLHKSFESYLSDELAKISPTTKDDKLRAAKKAAKYAARKKHSKETFELLCMTLGYDHIINSCKRSVLDDLADSFMQALAYHFEY